MIIARSPLRVGLVGGGSDIPAFFRRHSGAVLGLTFAKYVYVVALPLSKIARENIRFTYRYSESAMTAHEIEHPVVREALLSMPSVPRVNIATLADLPGGTGLGSSSAFTNGLLMALNRLTDRNVSTHELAMQAIRLERERLGEAGGWQDQAQTAYGGLRLYEFSEDRFVARERIAAPWVPDLSQHLVLVHTGLPARRSSQHQVKLQARLSDDGVAKPLQRSAQLARDAYDVLRNTSTCDEALEVIAHVVKAGWEDKVKSARGELDHLHSVVVQGLNKGAAAGKLLGAGGSGFILFVLRDESMTNFIRNWTGPEFVDVVPEAQGTEIVSPEISRPSDGNSISVPSFTGHHAAQQSDSATVGPSSMEAAVHPSVDMGL